LSLEYNKKIESLHVLAAISEEGLIGFKIFACPITAKNFGGFLIELINSYPNIKNNLNKLIFFMDNASIHKANCLKNLFSCLQVLYNAPYSPFLNPIEEIFGV
jgi:hypothetical protein